MRPYFSDYEICLCPATVKTWGDGEGYGDPLMGWDLQIIGDVVDPVYEGMYTINGIWAYGSYGKNAFVSDLEFFANGENQGDSHSWIYEYRYPNIRVKGVSRIPVFGDCAWMGGWPDAHTVPAETRVHGPDGGSEINQWNLDRHNLSVNMLFLDWTVRKVGLKQLWQLRWSKQDGWGNPFVVPDPLNPDDWPEWMRNSKNYDL
jgi:prepilin-type processing-associated H-X9-DG protein